MKRRLRWLLALAALLLLALIFVLRSAWLDNYLFAQLQSFVARQTGITLRADSFRIHWLLGQVEATGLTATYNNDPLFSARRAELRAGFPLFQLQRLELRALTLDSPRLLVRTLPDGATNWPQLPSTPNSTRELRLTRLAINNAELLWDNQQFRFSLAGRQVRLAAAYAPASRDYRAEFAATELTWQSTGRPPLTAGLSARFRTNFNRLSVESATLTSGQNLRLNATGELRGLRSALRAELNLNGSLALAPFLPFFSLPLEPTGIAAFRGKLLYEQDRGFELHGDASAAGLRYRDASTRLGPFNLNTQLDLLPSQLTLSQLRASAFGGAAEGIFQWNPSSGWRLSSELNNIQLTPLLAQLGFGNLPISGRLEGPLEAQGGDTPLIAVADLVIRATSGPTPVEGLLAVTYEAASNRLLARNSFLALPRSRLAFHGDIARSLDIDFRSTATAELLPFLTQAGLHLDSLPPGWDQSTVAIAGALSGTLRQPRFTGSVSVDNLPWQGYRLDHAQAQLRYDDQFLSLSSLQARASGLDVSGQFSALLTNGRLLPSSQLTGRLTARTASLQSLPLPEPLQGAAETTFSLQGTWAQPRAAGALTARNLNVRDFLFPQLTAAYTLTPTSFEAAELEARLGNQRLNAILSLSAPTGDWRQGAGKLSLRADALPLNTLPPVRALDLDVDGRLTTDSQFEFRWLNQSLTLTRLDGKLSLANLTRFRLPVGQVDFTARTTGQRTALTATGNIRQQPLKGDATILLNSSLATELRLQLPRLEFPTLAQLFSSEPLPTPLPYDGGAEASFFFSGPLLDPAAWQGRLTIPQLQLAPNRDYVRESLPAVADVVLRNELPIIVEITPGQVAARDVRFIAKDTNFLTNLVYQTRTGRLSGRARGAINLAILSTLRPDILAKGVATIDATLQGPATAPGLNGRLTFTNASLYLRDVVTGLEKVNGQILFDQNRATIETLTAQAGGGDLQLTGFVGFGKVLSYRLQAQATQVRLRYPEGVSTIANANLALTGTTAQSLLSGTVVIQRANIGQIDTGQLLVGEAGVSTAAAPIQNEFLRNLQFDVRVEAAQNFELATGFTKDVKGEVNLRLRGAPQRPVLLGRIAVTQGEIDFFGARYSISRGELTFSNPLRIEPILGLDLETRVRGVIISINFSGPANKFNMSYRSDPPLMSNEIMALLTVGRNPNSLSAVTQGPVGQTQGMFGNDSSVLVGAAVSAGINGRLQRFFGISRVRLDPQLTGIDNVPQARLTLEQQVSRDVTLTYITNLNRTQQQIVRVDWDISRTWSIVAVRDENGIFGLDLFFRRRLR
jgi:translocation and assembly module TamB